MAPSWLKYMTHLEESLAVKKELILQLISRFVDTVYVLWRVKFKTVKTLYLFFHGRFCHKEHNSECVP